MTDDRSPRLGGDRTIYGQGPSAAPEPPTGPLVVCPSCWYGFFAAPQPPWVCPNPSCGARFQPADELEGRAVMPAGREATSVLFQMGAKGVIREIVLTDRPVLIGRDPGCDVVLDNLQVSRRHCEVRPSATPGRHDVVDLGSSSGVLVGGAATPQKQLAPGDRIVVGGALLLYQVRFSGTMRAADIMRQIEIAGTARGGAPVIHPVAGGRVTLGRAPGCDVVLADELVSSQHARVIEEDGTVYLLDLVSSNGTLVNGRSIVRVALSRGDLIRIGPFVYTFDGRSLLPRAQHHSLRVDAIDVGKVAGPVTILQGISLSILPSEFVGLLGPSGAGKSTLMDALNGLRPATSGQVLINGRDIDRDFDQFRQAIGYVPQEDIIHRELTVREALTYTGQLRLPEGTALGPLVDEVIDQMELTERADTLVGALSGGQRKRVSLGVELLAKPGLLFLDEPTSGLDPGTEERMMHLFRRLADQGRTVLCTTHVMENANLFDLLVVLVKGRLAWFGPPADALRHFGIAKITQIYTRLGESTPEDWEARYCQSEAHRIYVAERLARREESVLPPPAPLRPSKGAWDMEQLPVLARRYWRVLRRDRKNLLFLMMGPFIAALLMIGVFEPSADGGDGKRDEKLFAFLWCIATLLFTSIGSCREIVKERAIYLRERLVNLQIPAYILSKAVVLGGLTAAQVAILLVVGSSEDGVLGNPAANAIILLATGLSGTFVGLVISGLVDSQAKAMTVVPMVLVPLILFSGGLIKLTGGMKAIGVLMITYWSFDALYEQRLPDADGSVALDTLMLLFYVVVYAALTAWLVRRRDPR